MKIAIINNSLGNVGSVMSAFQFYKYDVSVVDAPADLAKADLVALAGVGTFKAASDKLRRLGLWEALDEYVRVKRRPLFGICLGMQLFSDQSFENGVISGFGWIKGDVVRLDADKVQVPHMGWDSIAARDAALFDGLKSNYFYFMHSYHFVPADRSVVAAVTQYGPLEIVSCVRKDNLVGVQFHPEKSQGDGLRFLRNMIGEVL